MLLRWFPSASECEKKLLYINYYTGRFSFPGATFLFCSTELCDILIIEVIAAVKFISWVCDTKNTVLRYLEAKLKV